MNERALREALLIARARRRLPSPRVRRLLRQRAGLTPEQAAAILGVSRPCIVRWELGRREPRPRHVAVYLALLDRLAAEVAGTAS
jgi:DNA-binding transcriptional regulator YiaG